MDRETGVVSLERAKDWNVSAEEWRFYPGTLDVEIREAVAARGDKGISWEELRPGDNVYLVGRDEGRLIIVY